MEASVLLWFLNLFPQYREKVAAVGSLKSDNATLLVRNQYLQNENDRLHRQVEEAHEKRFQVVAAVANFETQRHYGIALLPDQVKLPQEIVDRGEDVPTQPNVLTLDQVFDRNAANEEASERWQEILNARLKKAEAS